MKKRFSLMALLMSVMLLLTACSSGGQVMDGAKTPENPPARVPRPLWCLNITASMIITNWTFAALPEPIRPTIIRTVITQFLSIVSFLCGGKELHRRAESSGSSLLSLRHRLRIKASGAAVSFSEADPDLYMIGLSLFFMIVIRHLLHRTF